MACPSTTSYGPPCQLDEGHRGHHSAVTFGCDACGRQRRGYPHAVAMNPWDGEVEYQECFLCNRERDLTGSGIRG